MPGTWIVMLIACGTAGARDDGPEPPPPVGVAEARADLVIWFIDDPRLVAQWNDHGQFSHSRLIEILRSAGHRPRIEHLGEDHFPARWKDALERNRLPQLLAVSRWLGEVRDLEQHGAFRSVTSQRLAFDDRVHPDLARRFLMLPRDAARGASTRNALKRLLDLSERPRLPGPVLPPDAGRLEAELTSRRATSAYLEGDPERLKAVSSARSVQLAACTVPNRWQAGLKVQTEEVALRGCRDLAVAVVECSFEGDQVLGADPVALVLVREEGRWKALTISRDLRTVKEAAPALCLKFNEVRASDAVPAEPQLVDPADGHDVTAARPYLSWSVASGGSPLIAQAFEHHFDDMSGQESRWPEARFDVYPPEPHGGKVNPFSGVVGSHMSWTVWTVGQSGRIAVAPARRFGVGR